MKIQYCLECGEALKRLIGTEYSRNKGRSFWNNPKTSATVILINNDKIDAPGFAWHYPGLTDKLKAML